MGRMLYEHIAGARQTLVDAGWPPEDAALDAEVLARHVLGWDLAHLLAHNREPASPAFIEHFDRMVARRVRREPVAFIVGHREFWGLDFAVTPATLVPRPETEIIVEEALRLLPLEAPSTVLDVGTGSGCLAVAIAHERPRAKVIATDISHEALVLARRNARTHAVAHRVSCVRSDLASGIRTTADVIVSNPPYVPETSAASLPDDVVRYEPRWALFGGPDGLAVIRRLLRDVIRLLAPGGTFIVEFGFGQEREMRALALEFEWHVADVRRDLQDVPRTMVLRR